MAVNNVFTENLNPNLISALKLRTAASNFVDPDKENDYILYKNGKMPWIKLQSSVDHHDDTADKKAIAKRWVLRSLFTEKQATFVEYEERNVLPGYNYNEEYGYRPLPGIISLSTRTVQPLGSLREAVVTYKCFTKGQLENLERLYMRPGFSCLLEWGWSYYLDKGGNLKTIEDGIDFFDTSQTEEAILSKIRTIREQTNFHYDGMIGFIKNFSWKANKDGSYDCSTTFISKGQLIDSMTANVSSYALDKVSAKTISVFSNKAQNKNIGLFKIEALTNGKADTARNEDDPIQSTDETKEDGSDQNRETFRSILTYQYSKSLLSGIFFELAAFSDIDDTNIGIEYQKFAATNKEFPASNPIMVLSMRLKNDYSIDITRKGTTTGNYEFGSSNQKKFIYLKDLIRIINTYVMLHYKGTDHKSPTPIFRVVNSKIPAKYHPLVMSSNYDICFVKPSDYVIEKIKSLAESSGAEQSVKDLLQKYDNYLNKDYGPGQKYLIHNYKTDNSHADASNILINLHYLYSKINDSLLQSENTTSTKGSVNLSSFLASILSDVSDKLGGICNLKLVIDDENNVCKIVDSNLLVDLDEKGIIPDYKIPVFGQDSIVKDLSVDSRIFSEQATMISIAAQVGGGTQYGFDSTVMGVYNDGLTDRFFTHKDHRLNLNKKNVSTDDIEDEKNKDFDKMTEAGARYVNHFLNNVPGASKGDDAKSSILDDSYLSNMLKFVESRNQSNPSVKNSRILPVNLGLTFEGISGFLIGNIINIDNKLIPEPFTSRLYTQKSEKEKAELHRKYIRDIDYYFVITGVDQSVNQSGWNTVLKTNYVLHNKDSRDAASKKGSIYSTKEQVNKVFSGDIVIIGFDAETFEEFATRETEENKDTQFGGLLKGRTLFFADLLLTYNSLGLKFFHIDSIASLIGCSVQESLLDPYREQRAFLYNGVWSGAGYGLIQMDNYSLRNVYLGTDGKGIKWEARKNITDPIVAHDIWDWIPKENGYFQKRRSLGDYTIGTEEFKKDFASYKVNDRGSNNSYTYKLPSSFEKLQAKTEQVISLRTNDFNNYGFNSFVELKDFAYQVEYIYTHFLTGVYSSVKTGASDFETSYTRIITPIVGGGIEKRKERHKEAVLAKNTIVKDPYIKKRHGI